MTAAGVWMRLGIVAGLLFALGLPRVGHATFTTFEIVCSLSPGFTRSGL